MGKERAIRERSPNICESSDDQYKNFFLAFVPVQEESC